MGWSKGGGGKSEKDHGAPRGAMSLACRRATYDIVRLADRAIDCGVGVFHVGMKILGPCLICLALGLIGFVTYTYFVYALPEMEILGTLGRASVTSLGVFLLSNALYNYGMSVCTDPGAPPEFDKAMAEINVEADNLGAKSPPRQCSRCSRLKPERCHHCSVCRRCVLKMDHHCPWINNCVGWRNYRYFCLFLLYLAASCTFAVVVFFAPFSDTIFFVGGRRRRGSRSARQSIMTSFMICTSILVALSILGGFHAYLVLTNQTTIEFQTNMLRRREAKKNGEYFRNPYDLGRTRNFQQVFGPTACCSFRWLLSWASPSPVGDGLEYPSVTRFRT